MTDKVFPSALIVIDFVLTDEEEVKISDVLGLQVDVQLREKLQFVVGRYLASTMMFYSAAKPSALKKDIDKLLKKARPLRKELAQLLSIDGAEEVIRDALSWGERDGLSILSPLFGIAVESDDWPDTLDARAALGNLIDHKLEELRPESDVNAYLIYKLVEIFELALQEIKRDVSSSGGALGDPYLDEFLRNLNKCYRWKGTDSRYSEGAISFIDVIRNITANRLEDKGFDEAAKKLRYLNQDGLKYRIRDAYKP